MQYDDPTYELEPNTSFGKFSFAKFNRYRYYPVYNIDGENFFGTYSFIEIPLSSKDKYHPIKPGQEGRWDLISFEHYQTIEYWWLICLANNIYNPIESPPTGSLVRVPDLSIVNYLDEL